MVSIRRGTNYTRELQAAIRTLKCPESSLVTAKEMWMGPTVEVPEARHFVSTPSRDRSRVVGKQETMFLVAKSLHANTQVA